MSVQDDSSTRSWQSIADEWVSHADTNDYRNEFLMPIMLAMVGDVAGLDLLDLGCGEGGYGRELARRGARVVGIDGSPRLIEVARQRAASDNVTVDLRCANANQLNGIADASFDRVLASMSLMDMEGYPGAIREVARVLRPGGELLMSITHPCFQARVSRWITAERGQPMFFAVDHYFDRLAWEEHMAPEFTRTVLRRHRPLEDYMAAPLAAGLTLREFREPVPTDEELTKSHRFWKLRRIPYFLFMRWAKS
jgi:ubiquinone/menaquinone biosynthesis C-methylase UbiE